MCIVSMIHDYGSRIPMETWTLPGVFDTFEDIVKRADDFDKKAKQPHCEDPEKLKFMEELRDRLNKPATEEAETVESMKKLIDELAAAVADRDKKIEEFRAALVERSRETEDLRQQRKLLNERLDAASAERFAAATERDGYRTRIADEAERADTAEMDRAHILAAFARLCAWDDHRVAVTGLPNGWLRVVITLPVGQVSFQVADTHEMLFTGLPFGRPDDDAHSRKDVLKRLAAYDPTREQTVIKAEITPERVLSILDAIPHPIAPSPGVTLRPGDTIIPHANSRSIEITRLDPNAGNGLKMIDIGGSLIGRPCGFDSDGEPLFTTHAHNGGHVG